MTPVLGGRRELRASLLIGLCCLLVYNANGRAISAGDTYPARYLPFAIWRYHTVLLDPIAPLTAQGRGDTAFWMVPAPGGHTSRCTPWCCRCSSRRSISPRSVTCTCGVGRMRGWTTPRGSWRSSPPRSWRRFPRRSSTCCCGAGRRHPIALLLTVAYAFGTTTWVISSQALWQHGMAELLVIGALLLLTGPCTGPRALAAGLLCGLIAANRPPDAVLAAALGVYGLFWAGRRRAALLVAAAALPMGLVLLYNLAVAGHVAGGYGLVGKPTYFRHDLLSGLGGLLFSPTRGLFVFSPFLLFLVLAWRHLPRDRGERGLTLAMSAGVALQLLLYAKADWRGGISWGPRYMTDLLPLLLWMLVPVVAALRGFGRVCFLLAVGVAIAIEAIGAFWYTGATDSAIYAFDSGPRQAAGRVGLAQRSVRRFFAAWPRAGGAGDRDARQSRRHRGRQPRDLRSHRRGGGRRHRLGAGRPRHALAGGRRHRRPADRRLSHLLRPARRPRYAARGEPRRLAHSAWHGRPRSRRAPSDRLRLGLREGRGALPGGSQADRADGRRGPRRGLQDGGGAAPCAPAGAGVLAHRLHVRGALREAAARR